MSEETIREMYLFDRKFFNKTRCFEEKRTEFQPKHFDESVDDESKMVRKELIHTFEDDCQLRDLWIDEISDLRIQSRITKLSDIEREILTLLYFDRYTQKEIAQKMGISPSAVNQRLKKIINFFEK